MILETAGIDFAFPPFVTILDPPFSICIIRVISFGLGHFYQDINHLMAGYNGSISPQK